MKTEKPIKPSLPRPTPRLRVPTVLQMEAAECGAACLAMVLARYKRFVPLETLRHLCGVSRDGTSAAGVVKAARSFGLNAKGFSAEPGELGQFGLPLVVFWEFNHFVVIEGFGRNKVHLNDPATGPRTVSAQEFDKAFTGVVLTFETTPEFEPGGKRRSVRDGLRRRLSGNGGAFTFVVLASCALIVPGLLIPALSRIFVDYYLVQGVSDWLRPLLIGMALTALLQGGLTWLRQHYLLRLQTRLALSTSCIFFWHLLRLPFQFFTQRFAGEIASRVALNDRLAGLIAGDLALAVMNLVTMVVYGAVMAGYDLVLTGVVVLVASLNLLAFVLVARRLSDGSQRLLLESGKLLGTSSQGLQMIESIKAGGSEDLFFARWAGHLAKLVNTEQTLSRTRMMLDISPLLLSMLGSATVLVLGGLRVMDGVISIGTLVAFQALTSSFSAPVIDLIHLGRQLQEAGADITRIDDILHHDVDPTFSPDRPTSISTGTSEATPALPPAPGTGIVTATAVAAAAPAAHQIISKARIKLTGRVEIRNLTFGYIPTSAPLVRDFSLDIEPGKRIALVGTSGSGKSTIGKLIAGLYRPWSGDIRYDGISIDDVPRSLLRNSVALVDQDIVLFGGSVTDNISLWDPSMPEDLIVEAARDACIHDDVAARPENYAFHISEGGRNFSGGQRQRIDLARALAATPSVLILDEASSALDTATEKIVIDNLRRRGCSCIIIAHRLSTIRDCDEIVVLDNGGIAERGVHGDLLGNNGLYRRLVES